MSSVGFRMTSDGPRRRARRERKRNRRAGWVVLGLVLALLVGGVFAGAQVLELVRGKPSSDYAGPGFGEVVLELTPGASLSTIGRVLEAKGVVASQGAFVDAAERNSRAASIQTGWYRLKQQMTAKDAVAALLLPASRAEVKVTLPEGLRLTEMLDRLSKATGISVADLGAAAKSEELLPEYTKGRPEGFLFPSTYDYAPDASAAEVVRPLVERFDEVATKIDLTPRTPSEVNTYDLVTIASLVEAEARHQEDYGKVARVVYNRLQLGMPLQFDSTVNYALNAKKAVVLLKDLKVNSPYNTYKVKGLPPGPINSPGEAAMRAALNPTKGNWVYFVTTNLKTGETKFTASPAEFAIFKRELQRNR